MGTEFTGTSISSGGDGQDVPNGMDGFLADNPHIRLYNGQRGYVGVDVTRESMTARFEVVPYVTREGAPKERRATFVVEAGRPGAQEG